MALFEIDPNLPPPLAPLAWLIGRWSGTGVITYPTMESDVSFAQDIVCSHDGRPFLTWASRASILDADGNVLRQGAVETGYWRPQEDGKVELLLAHPTGILEMYYGDAEPARIMVQTDSVMRSPSAKEYNAAARMYGLVESRLLWRMDMAAMGHPLQAHISAELDRVG